MRPLFVRGVFLSIVALSVVGSSCAGQPDPGRPGDTTGDTAGTPNVEPVCDPSVPGATCAPAGVDSGVPSGCGDGVLAKDEACDDGNRVDGDGCSADCLRVELGYSCNPPGVPCHRFTRCGDGVVAPTEQCDDGNATGGDGCSAHCKVEVGYKCEGQPSTCTKTVCGDGKVEGAEVCDDGNAVPFDGCSALCQKEPDCSTGACTSTCGDGLVINEECDDGNTIDGDGCSHDCKVEPGFTCSQDADCEKVNGACVLRVEAVFRDFLAGGNSGDFEVSCGGTTAVTGLVEKKLDANGKPVLVQPGACISSKQSFANWYRDVPGTNATIPGDIVLFDNGKGGFVNRWGPNGEKWFSYGSENWVANDFNTCLPTCHPCTWNSGTTGAGCSGTKTEFDGNPFFFPLDSAPNALVDGRFEAKCGDIYGWNWAWEKDIAAKVPELTPKGGFLHNFSFTTEVTYWFLYDATKSARLDFTGDDDVWVFINGNLAVDLGGLHPPLDGGVTVDSTTAGAFGLEDKKVYKINVFHAERKREGSSFRLTLAGFNTARSVCTPICGDGIVEAGEECDDGVNKGGYGQCEPGCKLGAYCGDGVVQPDHEDCDDGNNFDGDGCGSGCRILSIK